MKKIVFYVIMALMSAHAFARVNDNIAASGSQPYAGDSLTLDACHVNRVLGITDSVKAARVGNCCDRLARDIDEAQGGRESRRQGRMTMAVYRNLARMMDILTREEYHYYLLYINQMLSANDMTQYFE